MSTVGPTGSAGYPPLRSSQESQKEKARRFNEEMDLQIVMALLHTFRKPGSSGAEDTSTKEGKIKQILHDLQGGIISVDIAVSAILAIMSDIPVGQTSSAIKDPTDPSQKLKFHAQTFVEFLEDQKQTATLPKNLIQQTQQLIDQIDRNALSLKEAATQLNHLIDSANYSLPRTLEFPKTADPRHLD